LTDGPGSVSRQTMTEGMMRAWLVTPSRSRSCVCRCFDAGAAVAGDGYGQNTYANAQASGG